MPYALITGAAKGIGHAIAVELAKKNYQLLLVDIDKENLAATADKFDKQFGLAAEILHLDLSLPDSAKTIFEWSKPYHHDLSVIINNAGYGLNGSFESIPIGDQLNIIDVNIKAQLLIAHIFLPVLKRFKQSYLLNVGSTTCYQSVPYLSVYAASKAFVISFTRSLRFELKETPVSVSCLIPGSTDTDFVNRAKMGETVKRTAERFNMSAEEVGQIAIRGLFKKKSEIIPGFTNKLNAFLPRFFPKSVAERIGGKIYKPKEETIVSVSPIIPQSS